MIINEFRGKYSFLSNFYVSEMEIKGKIYPTVEHFYQASKTLIEEEHEKIRTAYTPGVAKRMGKSVSLRKDWHDMREDVMETGLREKFKDLTLKRALLDTGKIYLMEGNHWKDRFWGVDLKTGEGDNRLGKLLMMIRKEIA